MGSIFPAPVRPREVFQAFARYDEAAGLDSVLDQFDFTGVTRRQVYFAVLGRAPESAAMTVTGPQYSGRTGFKQALMSQEFQLRCRELLMGAFAEKQRVVFVHVPKCGGTGVEQALQRSYPVVHHSWAVPSHTEPGALFQGLRDVVLRLRQGGTVALTGHENLGWYQSRGLLRFTDDVFTVIREPREMQYSAVSYQLARILGLLGAPGADTAGWLAGLGRSDLPDPADHAAVAELGSLLLHQSVHFPANRMCKQLGKGTALSAIDALVAADVEVTDMTRYAAWKRRRFGPGPSARVNAAPRLFSPDNASPKDIALIEEITEEDRKLHALIEARLEQSGGDSARGAALA